MSGRLSGLSRQHLLALRLGLEVHTTNGQAGAASGWHVALDLQVGCLVGPDVLQVGHTLEHDVRHHLVLAGLAVLDLATLGHAPWRGLLDGLVLARHGADVLGTSQVWPVADLVHLFGVMPVRKPVLGRKALLGERHVSVELFVVVAHRSAGGQALDDLDGLGRHVLFALSRDLLLRRVDLVLAVVLQGVLDVVLAHVVGERRLVADVAGGLGGRGHDDGTRHLAVLGLEPVLGQELVVLEPRIGRDHVRRAVFVLADLHQSGMQDVLLLVVEAQAVVGLVAEVRLVGRRGLAVGPEVAFRAFLALVLVQLVRLAPGGPIFGVRDGTLHLLVER